MGHGKDLLLKRERRNLVLYSIALCIFTVIFGLSSFSSRGVDIISFIYFGLPFAASVAGISQGKKKNKDLILFQIIALGIFLSFQLLSVIGIIYLIMLAMSSRYRLSDGDVAGIVWLVCFEAALILFLALGIVFCVRLRTRMHHKMSTLRTHLI